MEKELVETFEAAKKAADAAAGAGAGGGGGSPEAERCVDALKRLRKMRVTTEVLVATQVQSDRLLPPEFLIFRMISWVGFWIRFFLLYWQKEGIFGDFLLEKIGRLR